MSRSDAGHVTVVAHDIGPTGGMERQLTELVVGLLARDWNVTVISRTCTLEPAPRLRWIRVRGLRRPFVIAYPWFFALGSAYLALRGRGIRHATGAIVANRVDMASVHMCHAVLAQRPDMRRASRPGRMPRAHARAAAAMARAGERWGYRPGRTARLVAVSPGLATEITAAFPRMAAQTTVIANGVNSSDFDSHPQRRTQVRSGLQLREDELCAVFVGNEWEAKGLSIAVEALTQVPAWSLLVVGRGDQGRATHAARQLRVEDRVRFVGEVPDVTPFLDAADAFILPAAYETFSLATYEAAARGLPLIVTRVNGVEGVVEHGVSGWFVERESGATAARLRQLAADRTLRENMGAAARERAKRYTWTEMVDGYERLYRAAAGPSSGAGAGGLREGSAGVA